MADKEATVFIIDLGHSMSKRNQGRGKTDLEWSLQWVEDKLTNIVAAGRKTLTVGVLGLGTDETANQMQDEEGYDHISELQTLQPMLLQTLRDVSAKLKPSRTDQRDALSAVILGVDMLMKFCGTLKWRKKIILVTNGTGPMNPDEGDILSTAEQIKEKDIDLLMLGIDFDDPEYGFKEEDKPSTKAKNEKLLRKLASASGGSVGTMAEAIEGLAIPYVKPVRPTPTFRGRLYLGDPSLDTAISIDIERYFKVASKRPPAAHSFVVRGDIAEQGNLQTIESGRTYKVPDSDAPGGHREVDRDELAKGYEYGRTAVHIAESDENITKIETESSYDILGFIPREHVERYSLLDTTNILVASKGNYKAGFALSSLVRALYEIDSVAVARLVKKDMSDPQLTLLSPLVDEDIECLTENMLPFAEDVRQYRFPPLDKVVTVSGKSLTSHRNLPNDKLNAAMDEFVGSMTLVDGEEDIAIEDTFSPTNFSIEHAIKHRALHTDGETPSLPHSLLACSKQAASLEERTTLALERLMQAADVKKVPPKVKGRKKYRETEKPLSGLNIDNLFKKERRTKIAPENSIPEFKQALERANDVKEVQHVVQQMCAIIKDRVRNCFGDNYERVIAEIGELRQELLDLEFPEHYNSFLTTFKKEILEEKLGGNRKMLWYKIRVGKLGLINKTETEISSVTKDEADDFLSVKF